MPQSARTRLLVVCSMVVVLLASSVAQQADKNPPSGPQVAKPAPPRTPGAVDILSDTKGVDFGPYLQILVHKVKVHWYEVIPEVARPPLMKKGVVVVEFSIQRDGTVRDLTAIQGSGDTSLDRAALAAIDAANPFTALPEQYTNQVLKLRFHFSYNPDKKDLERAPAR